MRGKLLGAEPAVPAVDEGRDRHEVLHEQRLKPHQSLERLLQRREDAGHGFWQRVLRRRIAIQVIDQRGVELLLPLERRRDEPPDDAAEPALPAAVDVRCAAGKDVPAAVQLGEPHGIVRRRGVGKRRDVLNGLIHGRQRLVVETVRVETLALEPRKKVFERLFDHRPRI